MSRGTPKRSIRADDELWERAKTKAHEQGRDMGDVTRGLWEAWLAEGDTETDEGDGNG